MPIRIDLVDEEAMQPGASARRVGVVERLLRHALDHLGEPGYSDLPRTPGDLTALIEVEPGVTLAQHLLDAVGLVQAAEPQLRAVGEPGYPQLLVELPFGAGEVGGHHRRQRVADDGG